MQYPHEAHVESHVAIEDVAELVGDHALKLVAGEAVECAACDRHHCRARMVAGGKGVDRGLVLQHIHRWRRNTGSNRHLVGEVDQPALGRIRGIACHQPPTQRACHRLAAASGQRGDLPGRAPADDAPYRQRDDQEQAGLPQGDLLAVLACGHWQQREIDQYDARGQRAAEAEQQPAPGAACAVLFGEEVHRPAGLSGCRSLPAAPGAPRRSPAARVRRP